MTASSANICSIILTFQRVKGYELAGSLRASMDTRVDLVVTVGFGNVDHVGKMVLSGASAFVVKGRPTDLVGAVRSVSKGSGLLSGEASAPVLREVRLLYEREKTRSERLERAVHKLQALSVTDSLTGLKNHGYFFERLSEEGPHFRVVVDDEERWLSRHFAAIILWNAEGDREATEWFGS